MPERLKGKIALITGAAGGIGADMAALFAEEGASIVIADILAEKGEAVAAGIQSAGGSATSIPADVSRSDDVDRLFAEAGQVYGGLDILVNNAIAVDADKTIVDLDEPTWDKFIDVCLKGPFLCARRALPMMKARGGGSVIWMSSVNALFGVSETAYTAAKGGLISMARLVAAEYGEWNIRSNVICPGTIGTEHCLDYWNRFPAGFQKILDMYPLGRIGTPREVSNLALFLASAESSFVTGGVYLVDGGLLAGRKFEVS
ncbi:MAG: glucose 1-dehydrogenase [Bryobacteraceae bacterium]|nr:glucose 1-dehydrogenase [Bryobacteraceae bacterium]